MNIKVRPKQFIFFLTLFVMFVCQNEDVGTTLDEVFNTDFYFGEITGSEILVQGSQVYFLSSESKSCCDSNTKSAYLSTVIKKSDVSTFDSNKLGITLGWNINASGGVGCDRRDYFVVMAKSDDKEVSGGLLFAGIPEDQPTIKLGGTATTAMYYRFPVNLIDPTLSVLESHTYTIEFWECLGACGVQEYEKKVRKVAEFSIKVDFVP